MGPVQSIQRGITKSYKFSGRTTRSEFWWFILFVTIASVIIIELDQYTYLPYIGIDGSAADASVNSQNGNFRLSLIPIFIVLALIPTTRRRLRDAGKRPTLLTVSLLMLVAWPLFFIAMGRIGIMLSFGFATYHFVFLMTIIYTLAILFFGIALIIQLTRRSVQPPSSNPNEVPS